MSDSSKEGAYCSVCGGISPAMITTRQIVVKGRSLGINKLDMIIEEMRGLNLTDDTAITEELLKRVKIYNYVPTARTKDYGDALLAEYKKVE